MMVQDLSFQALNDRNPPHNVEAEEAILGSILLDPEAITRVADFLRPEAFYMADHQEIFVTTLMLHTQGKPTDLTTVAAWLQDKGQLEKVGGQNRLVQLVDRTISTANVDRYAELVMEKYLRRQLIQAGNQVIRLGYDTAQPLAQVLDQAEQRIFGITQDRPQQGLTAAGEILVSTFNEIENRALGNSISGIPCNFYDLDAMTQGFQRSDLIIIAGRPSMGKTAFSLGIARNIAVIHQLPICVFSLEMSKEQLIYRLLSSEVSIESGRLRTGRLRQEEWSILGHGIGSLSELPIYIDDTADMTVMEMRSKARRLQSEQEGELGLVLIDYLQLMEGASPDNRVQELSKITRSLKGMARELNIPVIALSQLSRGVESRNNKRPMMSDLRESGCLAGDTLITMADSGLQVPIRELRGQDGFAVLALDEQTMKLRKSVASKAFSTGIKPVLRLTTGLGRTIRATANHKFLTIQGWKRLDELQKSDRIALPENWDIVYSIEPDGEEEVFDLTVPEFHNFVANNTIVHNSIEQDADLIIMLYRDEYYNPDTPDRGITEAIITKHRNGPVGTVKFLFEPQFARFRNLANPT
jgi:replicative DNA helicase